MSSYKEEREKTVLGDYVQLDRKQMITFKTIRKNRTLASFDEGA